MAKSVFEKKNKCVCVFSPKKCLFAKKLEENTEERNLAVDWLIQPVAFSIVHIVPGDAIASYAYSIVRQSNFYCKNDSVAISFLFSFGDGDKNLLNKKGISGEMTEKNIIRLNISDLFRLVGAGGEAHV